MSLQEGAALQEELSCARAAAASAQAALRLAQRQAARAQSGRRAEAQAADLVQVRPWCTRPCTHPCAVLPLSAL